MSTSYSENRFPLFGMCSKLFGLHTELNSHPVPAGWLFAY
ncbi:hypothetical protein CES85_2742 [Ochrobactrum quorumnocens]|uniref:Uncharacterized protein n=1 Tax=Ochrobactrum quorumnocens TaxID=271865 RepID=A0A248UFH1_9HYPH|nr:hypothetical protein CES85_2742 [[Ochrobactrum] quorumnocens]